MAHYWLGDSNRRKGDLSSAKYYFKMATTQGQALAQYWLADCYTREWIGGKEKSFEKALFWYICAYLHEESSPKASGLANEQIDYHIQHGFPASSVRREIEEIKHGYK